MIRAFVAAELSVDLKQALVRVQDSLKQELQRLAPAARLQWVRVGSIHLTFMFLGDIDDTRVSTILQSLEAVGRDQSPITARVEGLGVFPDLRAPRVLWMGLAGDTERLSELAASIGTSLMPLGFLPDAKPYTPHLTLARVKERSRDIGSALVQSGVMREVKAIGALSVQSVALMRSDRTPSGSIYSRLGKITLGKHKV